MLNEENENKCTGLQPDQITNDKKLNDLIRAHTALSEFCWAFNDCDTEEFYLSLTGGEYALLRGYLKDIKFWSKQALKDIKAFEVDNDELREMPNHYLSHKN